MNRSLSKTSIDHKSSPITDLLSDWNKFIEYLSNNSNQRPFKITLIADELLMSEEKVILYLNALKDAFHLFHSIQKEKILKEQDLFAWSQQQEKIIHVTPDEIKKYATYVYLWEKRKNMRQAISENQSLYDLVFKIPELFQIKNRGWEPSEMGVYFSHQYQKYLKLNLTIPNLTYLNYKLEIMELKKNK